MLTADEFWVRFDAQTRTGPKTRRVAEVVKPATPHEQTASLAPDPRSQIGVSHELDWRQRIEDAEQGLRELAAAPGSVLADFPTEEEIQAIAREVDRETLPERIRASHRPHRHRPPGSR
jgi:hypothetical protein